MAYSFVVHPEMTLFRITPDKTVSNNQNKKFWRLMHELLAVDHSWSERVQRNGLTFRIKMRDRLWFDMVARGFEKEDENGEKEVYRKVEFFLACPRDLSKTIKRKMQDRYTQATIEEVPLSAAEVPAEAEIIEYRYKRHNIFSLNCNDTEQTSPISSLMNAVYDLQPGDYMRFSVATERVDRRKWKGLSDYGWSQLESRRVPSRARVEVSQIAEGLGDIAKFLLRSLRDILDDILTAIQRSFFKGAEEATATKEKPNLHSREYEKLLMGGGPTENTKKKRWAEPTFAATIRLAVSSDDKAQRQLITNSVTTALKELSGDNSLEPHKVRVNIRGKHIEEMNTFQKLTRRDPDVNVLSAKELGKLNQYPTKEVQQLHKEILDVKTVQEVNVPKELQGEGMYIGDAMQKSAVVAVSQPAKDLNKIETDLLVQTRIAVGPPGCGKSTYGTNWIAEAVNNGFGALYIDPAKGLVGDEIERALPPEKVERYTLGKIKMALDFREVMHSEKWRGRLAKSVLSFFATNTDESGARTERFLKAAVYGMQTGRLSEIIRIFTDEKYRQECIEKMPVGQMHRITLEQFGEESEAMQRRILDPILTRLDCILGDEDLAEWMDCEEGFDFVELFQKKKAIIIDIPKSVFGKEGVEVIGNLLSLKMDLAMELRPEEKQEPFWIVLDEPHQFMKSQHIWQNAVVEARKWRLGYLFLFHEWLQIDHKLRHIIKSANPHITIFAGTSKHIWTDFREEIDPFDHIDMLKLPPRHAVNIIHTTKGPNPMILKMAKPADKRLKVAV